MCGWFTVEKKEKRGERRGEGIKNEGDELPVQKQTKEKHNFYKERRGEERKGEERRAEERSGEEKK